MEKKEIKKVISYLLAAYPKTDIGDKAEATFRIWENILKTFPYEIASEAANIYLLDGNKFFPNISEFVKLCDEVWQKHEREKQEQHSEDEREATKLLFSEPLEKIDKSMGHIAKLSVSLVRDVCDGKIKYRLRMEYTAIGN